METIINLDFFIAYDENHKKIESLLHAENDLANVTMALHETSQHLHYTQENLETTIAQEKMCSERIYRNEHPHFFHFLVLHRGNKIRMLKQEQHDIVVQHESLERTIQTDIQNEQVLQHNLSKATQEKQLLDACLAKQHRMFEECVSSVATTPQIVQLDQKIDQTRCELVQEQALMQRLTIVVSGINDANVLFQQSLTLYRRATMWNNRALRDDQWDGAGYTERRDQLRRDRLINQARAPAMKAYEIAAQALGGFPEILRRRYPETASQVGNVPLPTLQTANFGNTLRMDRYGYMGAEMNDLNSGCAIQQNYQVVQQCLQILKQQLELTNAIQKTLGASIQDIEATLRSFVNDRDDARTAIFELVRQSVNSHGIVSAA